MGLFHQDTARPSRRRGRSLFRQRTYHLELVGEKQTKDELTAKLQALEGVTAKLVELSQNRKHVREYD
jgi:hypothetical protein